MKFVLGVYAAPYPSQGSISAWHFANAVVAEGHELVQVFFAHAGVLNASSRLKTADDEQNWPGRWQSLSEQTAMALHVCYPSAVKYGLSEIDLLPGFSWGGLSQFSHALLTAERYLIFGD